MKPTKACPVVLRKAEEVQVLAFEHPLAGFQLVKGTIELNETPRQAALRELLEESGILAAHVNMDIGVWQSGYQDQVWSFHLCEVTRDLPNTWVHHTADDGGHDFKFFWHQLAIEPSNLWHEVFCGALAFIRSEVLTHPSTGQPKAML